MANTQLLLRYRTSDTSLYSSAVFKGEITQEQIATIVEQLEDHSKLISRQVGLPSPWEILIDEGFSLHDDTDHVYTSLVAFESAEGGVPSPGDFLTEEEPTDSRTIAQLVDEISKVKFWDIQAELDVQAPHYDDIHADEEEQGPSPS